MKCCQNCAILTPCLNSLRNRLLIFISPPSKGLAEPPHFHTLHAPSRSPHLLGGPCSSLPLSFRTIFNKHPRRAHRKSINSDFEKFITINWCTVFEWFQCQFLDNILNFQWLKFHIPVRFLQFQLNFLSHARFLTKKNSSSIVFVFLHLF